MTERAQALEAAKRVSDWIERQSVARDASEYSKGWRVGAQQAVEEYRAALAVQPPPPVGSPTTEQTMTMPDVLQAFRNLGIDTECGACMAIAFTGFGAGEHTCKSTPVEPAGASEPPSAFTLGQEFVSRVTSSNAPEGPSVIGPIERDEELVTFALELAVATLGAEGCACQPEEPCALCMCKEAVAHLRDTSPAPVSPVEPTPEPPKTECRCDCVNCVTGNCHQCYYGTPHPTVAPAPCVWREMEDGEGKWRKTVMRTTCGLREDADEMRPLSEWPFCAQCGHPLTVER